MNLTNCWNASYNVTLAPGACAAVAIDFGTTNNPPGLLVCATVTSAELLTAGHRLRLVENANVSNTGDPARGVHRDRSTGDALPAWLSLQLGMVPDDIFLLHGPGTFRLDPGGTLLWSGDGNASAPAHSGEWFLVPGAQPKYDVFELQNLDPAHTATFVLSLNYRFAKP